MKNHERIFSYCTVLTFSKRTHNNETKQINKFCIFVCFFCSPFFSLFPWFLYIYFLKTFFVIFLVHHNQRTKTKTKFSVSRKNQYLYYIEYTSIIQYHGRTEKKRKKSNQKHTHENSHPTHTKTHTQNTPFLVPLSCAHRIQIRSDISGFSLAVEKKEGEKKKSHASVFFLHHNDTKARLTHQQERQPAASRKGASACKHYHTLKRYYITYRRHHPPPLTSLSFPSI